MQKEVIGLNGKTYLVKDARRTGGKAGKGHNKTSTVQVLYCSMLIKQVRYKIGESGSRREAWAKALACCVGTKEAWIIVNDIASQLIDSH